MPSRRIAFLLTALALAAGCAPKAPTSGGTPTKAPAAAASTAATATKAPVAAAKLSRELVKPPAGASTRVQGTLVVDAGYLVKAGVGQVISSDGNSAVYPAASLIGNDGASIVAQGAGNLIANDGGSIIANDGGSLIGNDGGSLIGNDGASALSTGGGAAVAKTRRVLADAAAGLDDRQAAGFAIRALGLRDNRPVPLGVDGAGKPVYVVLTDAKGGYDLHLPEKLVGSVRLIASPPGATDQRATYNLLVGPSGDQGREFTEAASSFTAYARHLMLAVMRPAVMSADGGQAAADAFASNAGIVGGLKDVISNSYKACQAEGVDRLDPAQREFLLQRFVDAILDRANLTTLGVGNTEGYQGDPRELVETALEDTFGQIRAGAAKALAKDPTFFNRQHYVIAANGRRAAAGKPAFDIRKASDVADFVVDEYFGNKPTAAHQHMASEVLIDCGVAPDQIFRMLSSNTSIGVGMAGAYLANVEAIEQDVRLAIREMLGKDGPVVPPLPSVTAPAIVIPPAAPESYTVSTLAGSQGQAPWHMTIGPDGNLYYTDVISNSVVKADLSKPERPLSVVVAGLPGALGLAFDPTASEPTLYVADFNAHLIRRVLPGPVETLALPAGVTLGKIHQMACTKDHALIVAQGDPAAVLRISLEGKHEVTTLAGAALGTPLLLLSLPAGLALAPDGAIYVADAANSGIVRLDGSVPRVVAGREYAGHADGFYDNATFANPQAIAFAPDGSLIVADSTSGAVRRVRFTNGAGLVTTLAGDGTFKNPVVNGPGATAKFSSVTGVAVDAQGVIYVGESGNNDVRVLTPN